MIFLDVEVYAAYIFFKCMRIRPHHKTVYQMSMEIIGFIFSVETFELPTLYRVSGWCNYLIMFLCSFFMLVSVMLS